VPFNSIQVVEPVSGCCRRLMCVFYLPTMKKSCCPSLNFEACELCCASPLIGCQATIRPDTNRQMSHVFNHFHHVLLTRGFVISLS